MSKRKASGGAHWLANGDIGGTNSRMQLWEVADERPVLRFDRRYQSRGFRSLESLVTSAISAARRPQLMCSKLRQPARRRAFH